MRIWWAITLMLASLLHVTDALCQCDAWIDVRNGAFVYSDVVVTSGRVHVSVSGSGVLVDGKRIVDLRPYWTFVKEGDRAKYAQHPYCAQHISSTVSPDSAIVLCKQAEYAAYQRVAFLLASMKSRDDLAAVKAQVDSSQTLRPFVRQVFWAESDGSHLNDDPGFVDWRGGYGKVALGSDQRGPLTVEQAVQRWCDEIDAFRTVLAGDGPPYWAAIIVGGTVVRTSGASEGELMAKVDELVMRSKKGGR